MAGREPEERVNRAVAAQTWCQVLFLHWRSDAPSVAAVLPKGLAPDLVDGSAWLSIVAFRVERFRILGAPPLLSRSSFPETNLRTYARDKTGRDGVWFLSIDVPNTLNILGGRMIGVPYHLAEMSVREPEGMIEYRCRRRVGGPAGHDLAVLPGRDLDPGELALADSLSGRWRAFSRRGRLMDVPVEHEPWALQVARVVRLDESIFHAAGLPRPVGEPLAHFAEGVHARLGRPRMAATKRPAGKGSSVPHG